MTVFIMKQYCMKFSQILYCQELRSVKKVFWEFFLATQENIFPLWVSNFQTQTYPKYFPRNEVGIAVLLPYRDSVLYGVHSS